MSDIDSKPIHTVRVRDLVEFVLRRGDLAREGNFVGSDRALRGIRGHQKIQRNRPGGYQVEVPVEHQKDAGDFILLVRGRIDGLLATESEVLVEEIKTVQGTWNHQPEPLHWAQAKFYGFMHAIAHSLCKVTVQLAYLQLETGKTTEFREELSVVQLTEFFEATTTVYLEWIRQERAWWQTRNQSIQSVSFPFPNYRSGQRELAVAVYRRLTSGGNLFVSAPTGIGKTMSVLFPALKALGAGNLERLFYLTARTIGRTLAEKALADLRGKGMKVRSVTLTARETVCVRSGQPCDVLTCPLALGYYDRVKPAMREALAQEHMDRETLEKVALKHQVCPFELSLDVSEWADVVIGDYNYVFDPQVYMRRHFTEPGGYGFLVDEAHNLVDRAREMFSADLDGDEIKAVSKLVKRTVPKCARALNKLHAALQGLSRHGAAPEHAESDSSIELDLFSAKPLVVAQASTAFTTSKEIPEQLVPLVDAALTEAEAWLVQNEAASFREELLALFFRLHTFRRTAELYDERFVTIFDSAAMGLRLFCLDPSKLMQVALSRGKAAVFFSATLTPVDYYRSLLGGLPDPVLQLTSPFPPEHLRVLIQERISTSFKGRNDSLSEVVSAIATLVQGRKGNYLVYFPSYQYLNSVLELFQPAQPSIPVLAQTPRMSESDRESFLAALEVELRRRLRGLKCPSAR